MTYLSEQEIPKYCKTIQGVTLSDVAIATELINGYLTRDLAPHTVTSVVKLNDRRRGKLPHTPIIRISEVIGKRQSMFGGVKTQLSPDDIVLDTDGDGYFSYVGDDITGIFYDMSPIKELTVTYSVGYLVFPERLKQATAALAQNIRQAQSFAGLKQLTSLDFTFSMTDDSFFTSDIRMLLRGL